MAQPVWIEPAPGNLGTIPEGVFYQIPLIAIDPGIPASTVKYTVVAGQLPPGMSVTTNGLLAGVPQSSGEIRGVPFDVNRDTVSKFVVRAYTERTVNGITVIDRLADRTFNLTINGQNGPRFTTPAGVLAELIDGSQLAGIQIGYTDADATDTVVVRLNTGQLPPGLTLSPGGLISGLVLPTPASSALPGYSVPGQGYNQYPFDFPQVSASVLYDFTLEVTDGKDSDLRSYSIQVYSRNLFTADTTAITADTTFITADVSPVQYPVITTPTGSIGTILSDNYYAFQFQAYDFDGDRTAFVVTGTLPPDLIFDPGSGWLYGFITGGFLNTQTYDFSLQVFKVSDTSAISDSYDFSISITGPISQDITWLTPARTFSLLTGEPEDYVIWQSNEFLGTINNGSTSTFFVQAVQRNGINLQYRLSSGSNSQLPQGLQLFPSGLIAGRVSFDTFALDGGTTVFDVPGNAYVGTGDVETTFDLEYTFTVNAYSVNGVVDVNKIFKIRVVRAFNEPYDNLYIQAMPPVNDRVLINSLLQNSDIFPQTLLYRPEDPNFGLATKVVYYQAYGLTAATLLDYVQAVQLNHYNKTLTLGAIETAQALNPDGSVLYEIVYSRIIDDLVNNAGVSVGKEVKIPYAVDVNGNIVETVYPNSLFNMRTQIIDTVGQVSNVLPLWMTSKQANGQVLGFVPAWIIAYTKPGKSGQIKYNIEQQFGTQLNLVDYDVDRYEIDRLLSHNWDPVTQQWIPSPPTLTTFDVDPHYQLPVPNDSSLVFSGGINYALGNTIRILGSQLGGEDGINDALITVATVNNLGTIEYAFCSGTASIFVEGEIFYNVAGTNITGSGTGATWDIEISNGQATIFDGGSIQFTAPVDMYSNTQDYDKYVVFPKRNILE
jgi:hypothetical protein